MLRIINEPTAAALAYGLDKEEDQTILVFDLGGGTFDVSILELGDGMFEVKATSGNNKLGGDDFDQAIIDYLVEELRRSTASTCARTSMAMQRLKDAAEKAKKDLSGVLTTTISLPFITADETGPKHLEVNLTRAKFERADRRPGGEDDGADPPGLEGCGIWSRTEIDKVILVGGSTRIPAVQEAM